MNNKPPSIDLARTTLAILFICLLIITSLWILRPFLPALIWATMIVVATWPLMLKVQERLRGKRSLAVLVMTLAMMVVFIIPFALAIGTILENADQIVGWAKAMVHFSLPPPPAWLENLPMLGSYLSKIWAQLAAMPAEEFGGRLSPHLGRVLTWFAGQAGSIGMMFVHIMLTLALAAMLYAGGEKAGGGVVRFARRVAGKTGENSVLLAAHAIRAVALGVVVTALVQSILAGIGLVIVGMPYATLLTALIFMCAVAQIGSAPVLIAATVWLFYTGDEIWGTALLVWTIFLSSLDNLLRPILIRRGANLPLMLIFAGVIGGLLAFGVKGLFIGPVILAVSYTLLFTWVDEDFASADPPDPIRPSNDNEPPSPPPPPGQPLSADQSQK
ncbi:MAG: AI-2E family transporter YdiK [Desulfuromonadaceae bacterium]|nr:AI-2E family transporter YdiK [Desulfuromonadaceae bacterium]